MASDISGHLTANLETSGPHSTRFLYSGFYCTLYLHPLLIRVVTEGCHPFFFQILYCFIAGEDEHTIISAAVPSWSILCLCQIERAGMQKYCVDC